MKSKQKIKGMAMFLILLIMVEIFAINFFGNIIRNGYEYAMAAKNLNESSQSILINDIVKKQQELISNQIRQSLINYINKEKIEITKNDKWDKEKLEQVLNISIEPVKIFGNKGGVIVFDSDNGEVFLNTSTIGKFKNIKDNELLKRSLEKIMEKKDTSSDKHIVLSEKIDHSNIANYKEFPLGRYDRIFVDKIILPFETLGFSSNKQLTVLTMANEEDIFSSFVDKKEEFDAKIEKLEKDTSMWICITFTLLITTIIFALIFLRKLRCKYKE